MSQLTYIKMFISNRPSYEAMTPEQVKANIVAQLRYAEFGEMPTDLPPIEMALFMNMKYVIDSTILEYERDSENGKMAARARWHRDEYERMRSDANACE